MVKIPDDVFYTLSVIITITVVEKKMVEFLVFYQELQRLGFSIRLKKAPRGLY